MEAYHTEMILRLPQISLFSRLSTLESPYVLRYQQRELDLRAMKDTTADKSSFHIFNNRSEKVHVFGNQVDYVSIHKHHDTGSRSVIL